MTTFDDDDDEDDDDEITEPPGLIVVVNKSDKANNAQVMERLLQAKAAVDALTAPDGLEDVEYFPVSARTGKHVDELDGLPHRPASPRARPSSPTSSRTRPRRSG